MLIGRNVNLGGGEPDPVENFLQRDRGSGHSAGMSFQDLPADWPQRPITDPAIFTDAVDLLASEADRRAGAIYVLLCEPDGRLAQPCVITDLGDTAYQNKAAVFAPFTHFPDLGLVVIIARPGRVQTVDADREWPEAPARVCREAGMPLLAVAVATPRAIWRVDDQIDSAMTVTRSA